MRVVSQSVAGIPVQEIAMGLLEIAAAFAAGFAAGYGLRELISRRRRRAAETTFVYPE
jgi:hypothetical protein